VDSRVSPRTIALALLCLAVLAFAAATLDTTTDPDGGFGAGNPGQDDDLGGERTPAPTPSGDSADGRDSIIDLDLERGPLFDFCVQWLRTPLAQVLLLAGLVAFFLLLRWLEDAATALAFSILVAYPGVFIYLVLTACRDEETGQLIDLADVGRPVQEGGGIAGGASSVTSPDLPTALLLILVAATLVGVAVLVLTSSHDQTETRETAAEDEEEQPAADVRAIGEAAGRAADRIESDAGEEFENEVYRAWAEMTDQLTVEHPESSTPAEFATAAVEAGMDAADVDRLTGLFEAVRYGGLDATSEREDEAVETLRRIESAYAGEES
jgi:hypothetical protein